MMPYVSTLLSWRYLRAPGHQSAITIMMRVCFFSIALGAFALTLVAAIMSGFEHETHKKMKGVHADIIIRNPGSYLDDAAMSAVFKKEFPEVAATSPSSIKYVIMQSAATESTDTIIALKGIDAAQEQLTSSLQSKLITSNQSLAQLLTDNTIIIGKKLAEHLEVQPGQTITLLFTQDEQAHRNKVTFLQHKVTVSGIFSLGIEEFDSSVAYCSLSLMSKLFPDAGITHMNVALHPHADETAVIQRIKQRFHTAAYSWKELYPALVSALKLEKYAMFLIFMLISLVASMNIVSLLFMKIIQKKGDIAILKTMGMHTTAIKKIFILTGLTIAFTGCITGLGAAYIVGALLQRYPLITLPDVYYVTHLPIHFSVSLFVIVFFAVMVISFCAIMLPMRNINNIKVCDVLRMQ